MRLGDTLSLIHSIPGQPCVRAPGRPARRLFSPPPI